MDSQGLKKPSAKVSPLETKGSPPSLMGLLMVKMSCKVSNWGIRNTSNVCRRRNPFVKYMIMTSKIGDCAYVFLLTRKRGCVDKVEVLVFDA